jgi:hypothetical protein
MELEAMAMHINKQDGDVKIFTASFMMPTTGEHTMQLNRVIGKCRNIRS